MDSRTKMSRLTLKVMVLALVAAGLAGCWRPAGIGVGGKYIDGVNELSKSRRGGDPRKAIVNLQYVVTREPTYLDSLTQLGRAYYHAGRYTAALEVLKRALAVNKNDEIAWLVLGLTQFQRGEDEQGLASYKGGLTLLARATRDGYREFTAEFWDLKGTVRRALRRNISLAREGIRRKSALIVAGEDLLHRIAQQLYDAEADKEHAEYLEGKRDSGRDRR